MKTSMAAVANLALAPAALAIAPLAATLAAASAEFFPEHATLGATLATSLLRHREQAWRDAEEDYLSRLLTLAFCAFCGVADYAIMVH